MITRNISLSLFCCCYFFSIVLPGAHATAVFLDLCPLDPASTVTPTSNVTWSQIAANPIQHFNGSSYIRPDIGGALLPWVYSIVVLVVHIPVVVIRVVRWETVQNWCLAGTLLTVIITAQGYASTGFQAKMVLTWTPLLLVIDAGSMAQVIFLVNEDFALLARLRKLVAIGREGRPQPIDDGVDVEATYTDDKISGPPTTTAVRTISTVSASPRIQQQSPLFTSKPLYIAIAALTLLLTVLVLQILGLANAARSYQQPPPPVSWCSPIFQPFGLAALDGKYSPGPFS